MTVKSKYKAKKKFFIISRSYLYYLSIHVSVRTKIEKPCKSNFGLSATEALLNFRLIFPLKTHRT